MSNTGGGRNQTNKKLKFLLRSCLSCICSDKIVAFACFLIRLVNLLFGDEFYQEHLKQNFKKIVDYIYKKDVLIHVKTSDGVEYSKTDQVMD